MEATLQSYNAFLSKYELALSLSTEKVRDFLQSRRIAPIDYTRIRLYRIFNEDFTSGGRFYRGWWQNIPRDLRQYITIDGEPSPLLETETGLPVNSNKWLIY